jgi:uncharacterized CHY-type Zn-finger protein
VDVAIQLFACFFCLNTRSKHPLFDEQKQPFVIATMDGGCQVNVAAAQKLKCGDGNGLVDKLVCSHGSLHTEMYFIADDSILVMGFKFQLSNSICFILRSLTSHSNLKSLCSGSCISSCLTGFGTCWSR